MENSSTNLSVELAKALEEGIDANEFIRQLVEKAVNQVLQNELTSFLDYEKWDPAGYNSGNSRNGYYKRTIDTTYGQIELRMPRDRMGEFESKLLEPYQRKSGDLEKAIILMYQKGMTTRRIAELIEQMYGHHYSAGTISNLAKLIDKDVQAFHSRQVKSKYVALFCDATYIHLRRDTVAKEALHIIIGIDEHGYKEVLDYALYPSEAATNYKLMLLDLKDRGLEQVALFVSDGLTGLENAVTDVFPKAKFQACWTHLCRNAALKVRSSDKRPVAEALKKIYKATDREAAEENLKAFISDWAKKYPSLETEINLDYKDRLLAFFDFPPSIRRSLYTNNISESFNKQLKKVVKTKEQFPDEASMERTVCSTVLEFNVKCEERRLNGFASAQYEISKLFD